MQIMETTLKPTVDSGGCGGGGGSGGSYDRHVPNTVSNDINNNNYNSNIKKRKLLQEVLLASSPHPRQRRRTEQIADEPNTAESEEGITSNEPSDIEDEDGDEDGDDSSTSSWSGWTDQQHQDFVAAIFEIGLRQSSPSVIMENMKHGRAEANLNSERIKSKLQKYRNNKEKSKQEFIDEYQSFLQRAKLLGGSQMTNPTSLLQVMGPEERCLLGGDVAGYLTFAAAKGEASHRNHKNRNGKSNGEGGGGAEGSSDGTVLSSHLLRKGVLDFVTDFAGRSIPFPVLTEEEKRSPLGASMTFVMGLFFSMQKQLVKGRKARGESTENLKLSPAMEAAAAAATSAGMMAAPVPSNSQRTSTIIPAVCNGSVARTITTTRTASCKTPRVLPGKDFMVPSSAPQSLIYSAIATFLEREPSMNHLSFTNTGLKNNDDASLNAKTV